MIKYPCDRKETKRVVKKITSLPRLKSISARFITRMTKTINPNTPIDNNNARNRL